MRPCQRGVTPELLRKYGLEIGKEYGAKRRSDPTHCFRWPMREGQSLYAIARQALSVMTDGRCSYCDGHPIDAMGESQIDHFRPKSRDEFYELVCAWENLFLTCSSCNKAKMDKWDEALLRPDAPDYEFLNYFQYRTDTGTLEPSAAATPEDQYRARTTIRLLDLNRTGACIMRKICVRMMLTSSSDELEDLGYRFLIPLCLSD